MKKFNVTVNGKTYAVEVEEVREVLGGFTYQPVQIATAPASTPVPTLAPMESSGSVDGETLVAPMPGTILEIKALEGQIVKAGEVILILEAMKMENELIAPTNGKITKIHTRKGESVSTGDLLVTIG